MGWYEDRFIAHPNRNLKKCAECDVSMWLPKSKLSDFTCCSAGCSAKHKQSRIKKREKPCETCGKLFTPRPRQLRMGVGSYCSQACNEVAHIAMNARDAQVLARQNWKARHAASPIVKSGEGNPRWSGGPEAKKRRDRENGWPSQAARRANLSQRLPDGTVKKIGDLQKWKCPVCFSNLKSNYHVDHINPLKNGGKHEPSNIQILCKSCNLRKAAKDPISFMQSRGFLL